MEYTEDNIQDIFFVCPISPLLIPYMVYFVNKDKKEVVLRTTITGDKIVCYIGLKKLLDRLNTNQYIVTSKIKINNQDGI